MDDFCKAGKIVLALRTGKRARHRKCHLGGLIESTGQADRATTFAVTLPIII